jgi:hypothetical protein
MVIAEAVYLLCTATSLVCAILLARAYARHRVPLLLWSGVCFALFTVNNALVFVDLVVATNVDLSAVRTIPAAIGVLLLCYALITETVR